MLFRFERTRRGSPVSSIVANESSSSSKNTLPSSRARCTPRQKWPPIPNDRCGFGFRWMSKSCGSAEDLFVSIGRRVVHRHLVAGGDVGAGELGVDEGGATEVVQRVGVADDLLDGAGDERRICPQLGQLVGMPEQREQSGAEHPLRRVVAGGDELHEEAAEVDVTHRLTAEVGIEDRAREIVGPIGSGAGSRRARSHTSPSRSLAASAPASAMSGSWPEVLRSANSWMWCPVLLR